MQLLKPSNNIIKIFVLSNLLAIYFLGNTQSLRPTIDFPLSKADLIKSQITKITIEDSENPSYMMDYYLDKDGNDTALYINGSLRWMKKYYKGKSGKMVKWIQYDSSRLEESNGVYTYQKDDSYTIEIDYKPYGIIKQYETYDKQNKIVEEFLMDGGQHPFKYDSLSRLSKIEYLPGLDGYDCYSAEYNYNENSQLHYKKVIRMMPGPYEYSEEYFYNNNGLLVKSERTVIHSYDNEKEFYTTRYSYTFRK